MDPLKSSPTQENKLHFLDYWRIIRIRKTVILAVFLLVFITATLVTYILPRMYASSVTIKIEGNYSDIQEMTGAPQQGNLPYDMYFIATEFEIIQSQLVLGKVIEAQRLNERWGKKYRNGETLKTHETMSILKGMMDLRPVRNTKLVEIKVYNEDPKEAATLANAIAEAYKDYRRQELSELTLGGIRTLEDRFKEQEGKIRKLQQEADELRIKHEVSEWDAQGTMPSPLLEAQTVRLLQNQVVEGDARYVQNEKLLSQLKPLSAEELRQVLPTSVPDPNLNELLSKLNLAEQSLVAIGQDLSAEHPQYIKAQQMIEKINKQINSRVAGIMESIETQVEIAKATMEKAQERLDAARKLDRDKAENTRPYYDKKRELQEQIRFREILTMKIQAETLDEALPKQGMVTIANPAVPGESPVRPRVALNIGLGVVVGLIVGIGLAFFIEYLDTSVKTIDDVERTLQSPVLGVIPQNVGVLIDEGLEGPHAEAYRVLRTNLLFSRKDDKLNSVAVISAGAGEGKSTTVFNLATVFAHSGQRVVIVDSDLRRPTLHKMLRVANNIGLTNYLLKQNSLEEVIQTTSLPMMDFMASGKLPSSSLGILSSNQMKELISELKRRYDFVFFDSPPIMGVSDASILASEVDMTLQVIQYRRYPQPMNIRAKQLVEKVGGNLVGIVLNNINMSQDESYYYYSGYYHDYYSKNEEMTETEVASAKNSTAAPKVEIKQKY